MTTSETYLNNKVIVIKNDEFDKYPVRLGYKKLVKILNNLEDIIKFVKEIEKEFSKNQSKFVK